MARPPLYFVHGMWSRPDTFAVLRSLLEAEGWDSHATTLPYHDVAPGAPAPPALGDVTLGDYVAHVVRQAGELPVTPILVGHSMGGLIAQAAAVRLQPAGLVLLSTAPAAGINAVALDPLRTTWGVVSRPGWWSRPTLLDERGARFGVFNGVPEDDARDAMARLTWDSGRVLAQISFPWADARRDTRIDHDRLAMPALVVTGTDDRIVPAAVSRSTARRLRGAVDYHELPGVGHWLFHRPVLDRLHGLLRGWLRRFEP